MNTVDKETELLSKVPENGSFVGNISLLRTLGWNESDYWTTRNRLIERGDLEIGRGMGGSVRRASGTATTPSPIISAKTVISDAVEVFKKETALYPPISKVMTERWASASLYDDTIVQVTAQAGSKSTGKWSRPDIAIAAVSTYPYIPGRHFDIVTFEVKTPESIDITAVYEALSHRRSATRSYVFLYVPKEHREELDADLVEVYAEAKKHGIGVITAEKADDYATWEEVVEPIRGEPDPRRLNDFLAKQFTKDQLEKIMKWFK